MLRRSRGYVPASIDLPFAAPRPMLACGGQLKATFCLARGRRAWVSHHIGDLEHYPALVAYRQGIEHFERLFALRPELSPTTCIPDYASTAYALELDGVELTGVQHHHAHLAACLAEHGARGSGRRRDLRRLGVRHGRDDLGRGGARRRSRSFERFASLRAGAHARRRARACTSRGAWPARGSHRPAARAPALPDALADEVDTTRWRQVAASPRARRSRPRRPAWDGSSTPWRRSAACARSSRTRVRLRSSSRRLAQRRPAVGYELPLIEEGGRRVLDPRDAIRAIAADVAAGVPVATDRAALPRGRRPRDRAACAGRRRAPRAGARRALGRRVPESPLLERTAELLEAARPASARARAAPAERRRHRLRAGGGGSRARPRRCA